MQNLHFFYVYVVSTSIEALILRTYKLGMLFASIIMASRKKGEIKMLNIKNKKFILLTSLSIILLITLTGCMSGNKDSDVMEINYGHGFMPDSPQDKSAVKFKEEVEEKTGGKIKVNIFPSSQLGSAREMFEGLQLGTQEVALVPTARISGFAPELQLFDLPYLFPSRELAYELMDGEVGTKLLDGLERQYVKGVAFYEDGFKQFTSNREILSADDFKGQKFRTMESPIVMEQFKTLGSNPVPIDFAELYNSLQLGVIDGQENPLVTIENMKFYEVQKYLIKTDHAYLAHVLLFNDMWYKELPKEYQDILYEAGRNAAVWERAEVAREELEYIKTIEESGTEIVELSPEETEKIIEKTKPVYEIYRKMFGDEILDSAIENIKELESK